MSDRDRESPAVLHPSRQTGRHSFQTAVPTKSKVLTISEAAAYRRQPSTNNKSESGRRIGQQIKAIAGGNSDVDDDWGGCSLGIKNERMNERSSPQSFFLAG